MCNKIDAYFLPNDIKLAYRVSAPNGRWTTAQTLDEMLFGFAIFGALILSLTYIPMMCAAFLPKTISHKQTLSDRMMNFFQRIYAPLLEKAIRLLLPYEIDQLREWLLQFTAEKPELKQCLIYVN